SEKITGDVNSDGKVNVSDIVALTEWLCAMDTEIDSELSDVNTDGKCNAFDLIALRRLLLL
ncbi:MAG: dockerin type I domain-containing protein, partial [Porcipelethomonas sp.]